MDFSFYTHREYIQYIITQTDQTTAGDRIAVATMTIDVQDPLIVQLLGSLASAAQRGVIVSLCVDARIFLHNDVTKLPGPLWWRPTMQRRFHGNYKRNYAALQQFRLAGGHLGITNLPDRPFRNIHGGRSHIKAAVINDFCLVGGCNLDNPDEIDIMCGWSDNHHATWLYDWLVKLATTKHTKRTFADQDQSLRISDTATLLLDAGKKRQSNIFETALKLIDSAEKSLYLTCQFYPGGVTAKHINAAHKRKVDVELRFNDKRKHGKLMLPLHAAYEARERTRLPAPLTHGRLARNLPYLHAKVLTSESDAIVGSHNYVTQGVNFGTAEVALHVKDPQFAMKLRNFIETQIQAK